VHDSQTTDKKNGVNISFFIHIIGIPVNKNQIYINKIVEVIKIVVNLVML
jgi:hypothetical protein